MTGVSISVLTASESISDILCLDIPPFGDKLCICVMIQWDQMKLCIICNNKPTITIQVTYITSTTMIIMMGMVNVIQY